MDRNADGVVSGSADYVALRKESVDRNFNIRNTTTPRPRSLSARRAWIEMYYGDDLTFADGSLSARRAWIEICPTCQWRRSVKVALRKESVDRNRF